MIRTLIVDDDRLVRIALADILDDDPGITVVAQAGDGREALERAAAQSVDVVLMDVRMPRLDGIAATQRLRALPRPPQVVLLTTFDLDQYVYDGLAAGASGFLLKDAEPSDIVRAVHVVAEGQAMLHPSAARRLVDRYHRTAGGRVQAARARIERITPRERDVLELLADGASNAEIAAVLGMRESTVKAHVSRILAALEVGNRVQAALCVRDAGLHGDNSREF
ncbi:response regulator transcription factor [Streptomyces morookaense]|uniref:Response regulator transcription factor n=1 Tax=Streptomyces morookaense TaxID=1970 RepID=A0A7Y7B5K0_STRMO|nr:response regulator transcription factor [Streptomyces morookaense]NVK79429.1 response regulator transcription factor [Streptomyces morookaense]GHF04000.1 DNA-binding response regulator [Streptomyces morookaense]